MVWLRRPAVSPPDDDRPPPVSAASTGGSQQAWEATWTGTVCPLSSETGADSVFFATIGAESAAPIRATASESSFDGVAQTVEAAVDAVLVATAIDDARAEAPGVAMSVCAISAAANSGDVGAGAGIVWVAAEDSKAADSMDAEDLVADDADLSAAWPVLVTPSAAVGMDAPDVKSDDSEMKTPGARLMAAGDALESGDARRFVVAIAFLAATDDASPATPSLSDGPVTAKAIFASPVTFEAGLADQKRVAFVVDARETSDAGMAECPNKWTD